MDTLSERTPMKAGIPLSELGGLPPIRGIVKAVAPALPNRSNMEPADLTQVMPPFGSNAISPAREKLPPPTVTDLANRVLFNDPRDLWYLSLPSKLTPAQVLQILRSALGGDLWQQWQLQKLMSDSWVMFRKCAHELRSSASTARYTVQPYHAPGKQPTASAKAKADMVNRGFTSFRPDPMTDEKGFNGLVYHWTDAVLSGVSLVEIQWQEIDGDILPRAATWVHPRQFTFSNGGRISVWDMNFKAMIVPDPDKFMPMQYLSDSGSALGCGLMRPLAKYWSAMVFNWEWMIKFGQKHGAGFIKAFYPDGATEDEIAKLKQFCVEAQNQSYILLRKDKEDAEYTAPANLSQDNPHHKLCQIADEAAMLLLLGQTESTMGSGGSKLGGLNSNNGELQGNVRAAKLFEVSHAVATGPLEQLARAICRVNFDGDDTECPIITADFSEDEDPKDVVTRFAALLESQLPILASDIYPQLKLTQPNDGDTVAIGGKIGTMTGKADAINAKGAGAVPLDEKGHAIPEPPVDENGKPVQSSAQVKAMLSGLTDEEFAKLSVQFVKAMEAPHRNGELKELETTVNRLVTSRR